MSAIRVWRAKKVLRRLIGSWEEFGKILSQASSGETVGQPPDKGLLDLEARIAVDLPCMYELYTGTYLDDEIREEVRAISELVKRFTGKSLSGRLALDDSKGMVAEWNSHFVFMNRLLGSKAVSVREGETGYEWAAGSHRSGTMRSIGHNGALRFTAKALVVIVLLVAVVNIFGGHAADALTGVFAKLSVSDDSDSAQDSYTASSIVGRLVSWQTKAQVFAAEHRKIMTMGAIVLGALAVLYLVLFRG